MVDWIGQAKGLALPAAYIVLLMGLMATFSTLYRKRQAAKAASLEPWFPPHLARNIYLSLLHLEQTEPGKEKPMTVPDSILKAALLRRAVEDIHRIVALRSSKNALQILLQRGSVGDDLWQRFQRAEKELQAELEDVVAEANALASGWGQSIFQSANEMAANAKLRERINEVQGTVAEEKKWYEKKRDASAKELLEESSSSSSSDSEDADADAENVESGDDTAAKKRASASGSSEGDGVLVQPPEEAEVETGRASGQAEKRPGAAASAEKAPQGQSGKAAAAGGSGGGGKNKKRRGKGKK